MIICKILAQVRTIWFEGWFWSMEPYHRIVIEAEKFSPKFASRVSNKQWPIYIYRPKNMQNGRWSVDIVLRKIIVQVIFRHTSLPKNRGHVLTPDFDTAKNLIKIASNGEVLKVRKFFIFKRRNFDIWAVAIRSHL